jgi:8-oxo-dGTP pyrophosphatase MutT (NUDIX family)
LRSQGGHSIATRTGEGHFVREEIVVPFVVSHSYHKELPIGFFRQKVASALEDDHKNFLVSGEPSPWDLQYSKDRPKDLLSISFADWVNEGGQNSRTSQIARLISGWRKQNVFNEILGGDILFIAVHLYPVTDECLGWSNEIYPVYTHPPQHTKITHDPITFAIERAALPLFGLANFGCLLTAYVRDPLTDQLKLWIPRRSRMKRTWPGKLDVTSGGGMSLGDSARETIIRESVEEALFDKTYLQEYIRPVGILPYPNRSPEGWILPGLYYLFELPLPPDGSIFPQVNSSDGEVEAFELMEVEDVLRCLLEEKFKASSALAVLDFLIRHGYITEETDPRYADVCRTLKTDIMLPVAWRPH